MAEVLVQFTDLVSSSDGTPYIARACGAVMPDGLWQGWIEFLPADGGLAVRTPRETTQPNRQDTLYWATGLTAVYLEGALHRALNPIVRPAPTPIPPPMYDDPAPDALEDAGRAAPPASVLNPFSVYQKGEGLLRRQLAAMSPWHLVNIIRDYGLSQLDRVALNALDAPALIELIVMGVRSPASR